MALRTILTDDHPVLRKKSTNIDEIDDMVVKLAEDMVETMLKADGVGLAAPQVGINSRLITVLMHETMGKTPTIMINPVITKASHSQIIMEEGCLSLPNRYGEVPRAASIEVHYQDVKGKKHKIKASKLNARIIQHEIDHLDGILFTDKVVSDIYSTLEL
jgi:peptide deformylase